MSVVIATMLKTHVFWYVTSCRPVNRLFLECLSLKMKVLWFFKTSVIIYQSTRWTFQKTWILYFPDKIWRLPAGDTFQFGGYLTY